MSTPTDLVVIGAGPGGYAAAFYAADRGLKVALIDRELNPGGVCVYRGCIPSKALLHVAKLLDEASHASAWGVTFGDPKIDVNKLRTFKDNVVKQLTSGTGQLAKARKITYIRGWATHHEPDDARCGEGGGRHRAGDLRPRDRGRRLAAVEGAGPQPRQPAHHGLHQRAGPAGRPEDAARRSAAATSASSWAASTRRSAAR